MLVPRKIRQLLVDLRNARFERVPGGKGSHQKWRHRRSGITAIVSGSEGDDAKPYQERDVRNAIFESIEHSSGENSR